MMQVEQLIARQQQLVIQLEELAKRQSELIEAKAAPALLDLLSQRQNVIDSMLASQTEVRAASAHMEGGSISTSTSDRMQHALDEISSRLEAVLQIDERDKAAIQSVLQSTQLEVATLETARQARHAYGAHISKEARFSDRQG